MRMKTILKWSEALLLSGLAITATAIQPAASQSLAKEKQFTGKVDYVNMEERFFAVNSMLKHKTFELGDRCVVTRWDKTSGGINDLHPGQKVTVSYVDVHGVLAADRVEQDAMIYRGIVKTIDPAQQKLVLYKWDNTRSFALPADCRVMLYDQKLGALNNIKVGDHVSVVYETPAGPDIVRQIAQTSESFTGSVVAIDLPHRTVSAEGTFGTKRFSLANDCSIVMDGKIDAPLMDLRPGERLTINYDEANGVNVANRIAPAVGSKETTTAQANP